METKLLIIDDDSSIAEILEFNLKNEGFEVEVAYSAEEALKKQLDTFDLLLLDVMMGGISGYKMAEQIRKEGITMPIIFLTAKDTENDMLTGFSVGGDDYISKPFSIKEVIARVKAVLKRTENQQGEKSAENKLIYGELILDFNLKEVSINNEKIQLTKTEFELLALLAKHPNRIFSRENIISKLWSDTPYITDKTVDVHMARLRKKIGTYASALSNKIGYGYLFNTDEL